jgi:hypothetical protein
VSFLAGIGWLPQANHTDLFPGCDISDLFDQKCWLRQDALQGMRLSLTSVSSFKVNQNNILSL